MLLFKRFWILIKFFSLLIVSVLSYLFRCLFCCKLQVASVIGGFCHLRLKKFLIRNLDVCKPNDS